MENLPANCGYRSSSNMLSNSRGLCICIMIPLKMESSGSGFYYTPQLKSRLNLPLTWNVYKVSWFTKKSKSCSNFFSKNAFNQRRLESMKACFSITGSHNYTHLHLGGAWFNHSALMLDTVQLCRNSWGVEYLARWHFYASCWGRERQPLSSSTQRFSNTTQMSTV